VIKAADRVGVIVPPGTPHAVGLFPAAAVGRIHPGQPARLRLEGFAWTQYGTLGATVQALGNEAKDGLVRVELSLDPDLTSRIPREHGLPGTVEVEIERISPAVLVLRAAGHLFTPRAADRERGE
jgi:membrane fusion protein (multidrug efflux system)